MKDRRRDSPLEGVHVGPRHLESIQPRVVRTCSGKNRESRSVSAAAERTGELWRVLRVRHGLVRILKTDWHHNVLKANSQSALKIFAIFFFFFWGGGALCTNTTDVSPKPANFSSLDTCLPRRSANTVDLDTTVGHSKALKAA